MRAPMALSSSPPSPALAFFSITLSLCFFLCLFCDRSVLIAEIRRRPEVCATVHQWPNASNSVPSMAWNLPALHSSNLFTYLPAEFIKSFSVVVAPLACCFRIVASCMHSIVFSSSISNFEFYCPTDERNEWLNFGAPNGSDAYAGTLLLSPVHTINIQEKIGNKQGHPKALQMAVQMWSVNAENCQFGHLDSLFRLLWDVNARICRFHTDWRSIVRGDATLERHKQKNRSLCR